MGSDSVNGTELIVALATKLPGRQQAILTAIAAKLGVTKNLLSHAYDPIVPDPEGIICQRAPYTMQQYAAAPCGVAWVRHQIFSRICSHRSNRAC